MTRLSAVPDRPPRAVAYVRVSDEGGRGDDLMSPQIQMTAIRDHCSRRGYDLVEVLEDIDRSGRLWKRRQMETAVAMVESGACEVVVVWKVSRVSRNRLDWAVAVDRVESAGGQLESATEPVDTSTSTGKFTRGMLAELAAFESDRMGETWREVHRQRTDAGLPHYAPARLGYTYTRDGGYQIEEDGADIVRELYRRYTLGEGVGELTRWLSVNGVAVPKSGALRWTRYGVQYFLDSGFAAGLLYAHDPACRCGKRSCSNRAHRPGAHPAIITVEQWQAYQHARDSRRGSFTQARAVASKLAGVVLCGGCGRPMQLQGSGGKSGAAYVCRSNRLGVIGCPAPAWVRRDRCEAAVRDWLPGVAAEIEALEVPAVAVSSARRDRLARKVLADDEALANLTMDFARRVIPEAAFTAARDRLVEERAAAVAELEGLPSAEGFAVFEAAAAGLLLKWDEGGAGELNRVLRELLRVNVSRGATPMVVPLWQT